MKTLKSFKFKLENAREEEGKGILTGWANVFRKDGKRVVDRQGDYIMPGALPEPKRIPFLMGHDPDKPVGSCYCYEHNDGKGNVGIRFEARLDIDSPSKRIRERAEEAFHGAKKGLYPYTSIGFRVLDARHGRDPETREPIYIIKKIDLMELSLVTTPANPYAAVEQVLGRMGGDDHKPVKGFTGKDYGITWGELKKTLVDTLVDPKVRESIGEVRWGMKWYDSRTLYEIGCFIENDAAREYVQNELAAWAPLLLAGRG
jgi:HK97 family phage prohead protease